MTTNAQPSLAHYRWYNDDGSESASTAVAAQDTAISLTADGTGDKSYLLRIGVQNTNSTSTSFSWDLQYSKNGGAFTTVTTATSNVKAFNSANLTDSAATTSRLTSMTG